MRRPEQILSAPFICTIFNVCGKKNDSASASQSTYLKVSYNLHTNFGNQVYDTTHSSFLKPGTGLMDSWIFWENESAIGSTYTCGARNMGTYYQVHLYDSATGVFFDTRSILVFTFPSTKSFTNLNDTSVLINIRDTAYTGHAMVSVNITRTESDDYAEPIPTINGSFNMSGKVSNIYNSDSVSFSSSGTFTNMKE
jgi:hypothetical protein